MSLHFAWRSCRRGLVVVEGVEGYAFGKNSMQECKLPAMTSIRRGGEKFLLISVTSLDRLKAAGEKRESAAETGSRPTLYLSLQPLASQNNLKTSPWPPESMERPTCVGRFNGLHGHGRLFDRKGKIINPSATTMSVHSFQISRRTQKVKWQRNNTQLSYN